MQAQVSVWDYYKPGFVDPLYAPYLKDKDGRYMNKRPNGPLTNVRPAQVRVNRGKVFQRKHANNPCPLGWTPGPDGYCYDAVPEVIPLTEQTFYGEPRHQDYLGNDRRDTRNSYMLGYAPTHKFKDSYLA